MNIKDLILMTLMPMPALLVNQKIWVELMAEQKQPVEEYSLH